MPFGRCELNPLGRLLHFRTNQSLVTLFTGGSRNAIVRRGSVGVVVPENVRLCRMMVACNVNSSFVLAEAGRLFCDAITFLSDSSFCVTSHTALK